MTNYSERRYLRAIDLTVSLREFDDDSFDGALMLNVLYAIPDRARCLQEIYRVLKPGGVLVYSTSTDKTDIDRLFSSIKRGLKNKKIYRELRPVVDLAYERHRAMKREILRDSSADVVGYAHQAGFTVHEGDVWSHEYEGAVTIVRAVKPQYISEPVHNLRASTFPPSGQLSTSEHGAPWPVSPVTGARSNGAAGVFISYAREDKLWCDQIMRYLRPAQESGRIKIWADTEIRAGDRWEAEIADNLHQASLALLLVTPNFLASDYICTRELPWMLEKKCRDQLILMPVMVEKALIDAAHIKYTDPVLGPQELRLADLHFEMYEEQPLSHLEKPQQNLFIDMLSQSVLERLGC